ncbi:hypothetical protein NC652_009939 [Populus alba x Populus x berolinensis]|nr:hypothetical protein NC652_009939 [Populus alba x Populus x berolinensis]
MIICIAVGSAESFCVKSQNSLVIDINTDRNSVFYKQIDVQLKQVALLLRVLFKWKTFSLEKGRNLSLAIAIAISSIIHMA